jgi:hypothetical protein
LFLSRIEPSTSMVKSWEQVANVDLSVLQLLTVTLWWNRRGHS